MPFVSIVALNFSDNGVFQFWGFFVSIRVLIYFYAHAVGLSDYIANLIFVTVAVLFVQRKLKNLILLLRFLLTHSLLFCAIQVDTCRTMTQHATRVRLLLSMLLVAYFLVPTAARRGGRGHHKPYYAIDGDTIRHGNERIRLEGIYAAEMDQRGGQHARDNLRHIMKQGDVHVERHGQDRYGRTLGDLYVGGQRVTQDDIGPRDGNGASRKP